MTYITPSVKLPVTNSFQTASYGQYGASGSYGSNDSRSYGQYDTNYSRGQYDTNDSRGQYGASGSRGQYGTNDSRSYGSNDSRSYGASGSRNPVQTQAQKDEEHRKVVEDGVNNPVSWYHWNKEVPLMDSKAAWQDSQYQAWKNAQVQKSGSYRDRRFTGENPSSGSYPSNDSRSYGTNDSRNGQYGASGSYPSSNSYPVR